MNNTYPSNRLFALDALRGLDMLLLTVIGPLIEAAQRSWHVFPKPFMTQFDHGWVCFTLWDIIMPLFIFMCGAAIPFALERRLAEGKAVFWRHVIARVLLLWFLGGLVQGCWIQLNAQTFSPYSNTLQTIAIGYLVVAATMALKVRVLTVVVPIALAAIYTVILAWSGYAEYGNAAFQVDQAVFKAVLPATSRWIVHPSHYTWFLTSTMFAAMAFAGYHATQILRSPRTPGRKAVLLFAYAAALLTVGLVSEIWIPCIKPIFTLSFTAQAMGWCVLALDVLYVVTDIRQIRFGAPVLLLFGQFALTAYFTSHFMRPILVASAHLVGDGAIRFLPKNAQGFAVEVLTILAMVATMLVWRRFRKSARQGGR